MSEPGSSGDGEQSRGADTPQSSWGGSTIWSDLLLASQRDGSGAEEALQRLCQRYWRPIYGFIRRRGHNPSEAEDLTQDFFRHFLGHKVLEKLDLSKGRFRSFLLVILKNFLANERDKAEAEKRGGGKALISLDNLPGEEIAVVATPGLNPEALYDRRWALNVLSVSMARLEAAETAVGRIQQFERLKIFLTVDAKDDNYQAAGADLEMTREAVGMAVSRLRDRFGAVVREEIACTVTRPEQVEEELRSLKAALREV